MKYIRNFQLMVIGALVALSMVAWNSSANAVTLTTGTGWTDGTIGSTSDVLSYDFTLTQKTYFSLTDCCIVGDTWTIAGSFAGVSTVGLAAFVDLPTGLGDFPGTFDANWRDASFGHFQILLNPGAYAIRVTGDGLGGLPASLGVRLDVSAVPIPAALPLLMSGLGALGFAGWRKKKAAKAA